MIRTSVKLETDESTKAPVLPLRVDSAVLRDELVHDERHCLVLGRHLLDPARVRVSDEDNASTAWTDVAGDSHHSHHDHHEEHQSYWHGTYHQLGGVHRRQNFEHDPVCNKTRRLTDASEIMQKKFKCRRETTQYSTSLWNMFMIIFIYLRSIHHYRLKDSFKEKKDSI